MPKPKLESVRIEFFYETPNCLKLTVLILYSSKQNEDDAYVFRREKIQ